MAIVNRIQFESHSITFFKVKMTDIFCKTKRTDLRYSNENNL